MFISKAHKYYSSYIDNRNRKQHNIVHSRGTIYTYLCLYIIRKVQKHMKLFIFQNKIPQVPTVFQKTN